MSWKTIDTMPIGRMVQIGNRFWTTLAERKQDAFRGLEWIEERGDVIPWEETTATHWREYDAPPAI